MRCSIIPAFTVALVVAYNSAYSLKFIAYGDTRNGEAGNHSTWIAQANSMEAENPGLILNY